MTLPRSLEDSRQGQILSTSASASAISTATAAATTADSTTSSTESSPSTKSVRNSAIAGYVAGVVGVLIGHPFDSAIVWLQTNSTGENKFMDNSSSSSSSKSDNKTGRIHSSSSSKSSSFSHAKAGGGGRGGVMTTTYHHPTTPSSSSTKGSFTTLRTILEKLQPQQQPSSSRGGGGGGGASAAIVLNKYNPQAAWNAIRALYSGASVPLATVGIVGSMNFMIYDSLRRLLYQYQLQHQEQYDYPSSTITNNTTTTTQKQEQQHQGKDDYLIHGSLFHIAISGFVAGAALSTVTAPFAFTKVRQQVTGNGFRETVRELFWKSGDNNNNERNNQQKHHQQQRQRQQPTSNFIVRGLAPHLLWGTVGRAMYYATYEYGKRTMSTYRTDNSKNELIAVTNLSASDRMMCAGLAGILCCSIMFPVDSVRSRWFDHLAREASSSSSLHAGKHNNIHSTMDLVKVMLYEHGDKKMSLRSFYRGFGLSVIRAGPLAAVVLPMYDIVLDYLSS